MDIEKILDTIFPFLKNWWLSLFLFPFGWILTEQFWMALSASISFSYNYPYPFFIFPAYFFIDNLTLFVHESGHVIFGIFGWEFLTVLGGTLMEVLIPILIFLSGLFYKQPKTCQLGLFWCSFALYDTSAYCLDAKLRALPLIGNLPKSAHDFYNLLTMTHSMPYYRHFAWGLYIAGFILFLLSMAWPILGREKEYVDLELNL